MRILRFIRVETSLHLSDGPCTSLNNCPLYIFVYMAGYHIYIKTVINFVLSKLFQKLLKIHLYRLSFTCYSARLYTIISIYYVTIKRNDLSQLLKR